jgi:hypothetical protein
MFTAPFSFQSRRGLIPPPLTGTFNRRNTTMAECRKAREPAMYQESGALHKAAQELAAAGMAQLAQGLRLYLAHSLPRDIKIMSNLF